MSQLITSSSCDRVERHTSQHVNERIQRQMEGRVRYYANHIHLIDNRLQELDREWDVERWLELNSSVLSLTGLIMARRDRRWLWLPLAVQTFFLQHSIQGWCPPLPILRRLGVRTQREIGEERCALETLRQGMSVPMG